MNITHGEFKISTKNNLLITDAMGPFNKQLIQKFAADIEQEIRSFNAHWGQIAILRGNCLLIPEAAKELEKVTIFRKNNGQKYIAIVLLNTQCTFILEKQLSEIYLSVQIPFKFFSQYSFAEEWITDKLTAPKSCINN